MLALIYILLVISFALNVLLTVLVILLRDEINEYKSSALTREEIELLKRRLEKIKR